MTYTIQLRRDSVADWTSVNPTLAQGEAGVETDTGKFKIGDGTTAWNALAYAVDYDIWGLPDPTGAADGKISITQDGEWILSDLPEVDTEGSFRGEWAAFDVLATYNFSDGIVPSTSPFTQAQAQPFGDGSTRFQIANIASTPTTGRPAVSKALQLHQGNYQSLHYTMMSLSLAAVAAATGKTPTKVRSYVAKVEGSNGSLVTASERVGGSNIRTNAPASNWQQYTDDVTATSTYDWRLQGTDINNGCSVDLFIANVEVLGTADPYMATDVVAYNNKLYQSSVDNNTTTPGSDPSWTLVLDPSTTVGPPGPTGRGFTPKGAWSSATAYAVDDIVTYLGETFRAVTAATNVNPSTAGSSSNDVTVGQVIQAGTGNLYPPGSSPAYLWEEFTPTVNMLVSKITVAMSANAADRDLTIGLAADASTTFFTGASGVAHKTGAGNVTVTLTTPKALVAGTKYRLLLTGAAPGGGAGDVAVGSATPTTVTALTLASPREIRSASHAAGTFNNFSLTFSLIETTTTVYWEKWAAKGADGATGAAGAAGSAAAWPWKGPYSQYASYVEGDTVSFAGTTYRARSAWAGVGTPGVPTLRGTATGQGTTTVPITTPTGTVAGDRILVGLHYDMSGGYNPIDNPADATTLPAGWNLVTVQPGSVTNHALYVFEKVCTAAEVAGSTVNFPGFRSAATMRVYSPCNIQQVRSSYGAAVSGNSLSTAMTAIAPNSLHVSFQSGFYGFALYPSVGSYGGMTNGATTAWGANYGHGTGSAQETSAAGAVTSKTWNWPNISDWASVDLLLLGGSLPSSIPGVFEPLNQGVGQKIVNAQTGTAYTLVYEDLGKWITMNNASASTLTVPPNSAVPLPIGTQIEGVQLGAGQVTITPGSGVTVNATPGLKIAAQYGTFGLTKVGTDTWVAYGRLSA